MGNGKSHSHLSLIKISYILCQQICFLPLPSVSKYLPFNVRFHTLSTIFILENGNECLTSTILQTYVSLKLCYINCTTISFPLTIQYMFYNGMFIFSFRFREIKENNYVIPCINKHIPFYLPSSCYENVLWPHLWTYKEQGFDFCSDGC